MCRKIACTGIKPTGTPHIGNYFGAIKPALELTKEYEARYFIADYHALNIIKDPAQLKESTYKVAASWLACGLDPEKALIYRQSSVHSTFELSTLLMGFTPKGLMNRAHAYKAMIQSNKQNSKDPDDGVNMGLFTYPILMAADILQFDSNIVPVGKDQAQHLEMTVDIAENVNRNYNKELLTIPQALIRESSKTIVGLDGRKMSKSYNNVIPLFGTAKKMRKLVMKIVTNSQAIEEPKNPDTCNVFTLYKLFSTTEEQLTLRNKYLAGGMGWGEAKQILFEAMDRVIAPMREKYNNIIEDKALIDKILDEGSLKAAELVDAKLRFLRKEIGLG